MRCENAAKNHSKYYQITNVSICLHEIYAAEQKVMSDFGPEVDIPQFLRMRNEKTAKKYEILPYH